MRAIAGWSKFPVLCLLLAVFWSLGCSIPVLEEPECTQSREAVKKFYSFHFGGEMNFSRESLEQREKFLTPEFSGSLRNLETDADVFTTNSTDFPTAFRVGKCEVIAPDRTNLEILLFWKGDERKQQRAISVEVVRQNGQWLINKVTGGSS